MFDGASNFAESVDTAFLFILIVSVFFLVLITALMIFFVIRFSRKRNPKPKNIHGNVPLEITWTIVPTILVLIMFYIGWTGYKEMAEVPKDAMPIEVTGQMWQWKFRYENGKQTDTLYVPLNKAVKVNLNSVDVNHSFYIPAFKFKKDVLPGRKNVAWFIPTKPGVYTLTCAEYCGLRHSYMLTKVIVIPQDKFDKWLNKK
ncbi:MAG: cytochrome c oxidase subunit II [Ignavibacteria bacterium]